MKLYEANQQEDHISYQKLKEELNMIGKEFDEDIFTTQHEVFSDEGEDFNENFEDDKPTE